MAWKAPRLWMGSLLICTWAVSAQADECQKNEDCPKGFSCEVSMSTPGCDSDAPRCEPGADCSEPLPCDAAPVEMHSCEPMRCASDGECGAGMVCFKEAFTECSGSASEPACAPGEKCEMPAPPDEPSCSEVEVALCLPRYVLPCQQDADCGDGFSCEAGEECMCSGSAGGVADGGTAEPSKGEGEDFSGFAPVPSDAGADSPAPTKDAAVGGDPPTCECRPTERKHCELKVLSCSSDADCPVDFACKSWGNLGSASCMPSESGETVCESEPVAPAELRCVPRYDFPTRGGTKGGASSSDDPSYEEGEDTSHAADAGIAAPQAPSDDDGGAAPDRASSCSVTTPRAGALPALLAPIAFVWVALRARTRRKPR